MMIRATCHGCTRLLFVKPPALEKIVEMLAGVQKQGGKVGVMVSVLTPLLSMIPADAMDHLPEVMQIYCPVCTAEILERAESLEGAKV